MKLPSSQAKCSALHPFSFWKFISIWLRLNNSYNFSLSPFFDMSNNSRFLVLSLSFNEFNNTSLLLWISSKFIFFIIRFLFVLIAFVFLSIKLFCLYFLSFVELLLILLLSVSFVISCIDSSSKILLVLIIFWTFFVEFILFVGLITNLFFVLLNTVFSVFITILPVLIPLLFDLLFKELRIFWFSLSCWVSLEIFIYIFLFSFVEVILFWGFFCVTKYTSWELKRFNSKSFFCEGDILELFVFLLIIVISFFGWEIYFSFSIWIEFIIFILNNFKCVNFVIFWIY